MKLDLKKFKKVKSDKKSTTMRHEDGHELRIAHQSLSPKMREQMAALPMAEGGEVAGNPQSPPPVFAEDDAIQSYNPVDTIIDVAKSFANNIHKSMTADTANYQAAKVAQDNGDPEPMKQWMLGHANQIALGTIGSPVASAESAVAKVPFHKQMAAEKAAATEAMAAKPTPMSFHERAALEKMDQGIASQAKAKPTAAEVNNMDQGVISGEQHLENVARGKEKIKMADGGDVPASHEMTDEEAINAASQQDPTQEPLGTAPPAQISQDLQNLKDMAAADTLSQAANQPVVAQPQMAAMPQQQVAQPQQQVAQPQQMTQPAQPQQTLPTLADAYQNQIAGINQQAAAESQANKLKTQELVKAVDQQKLLQTHFEEQTKALESERQSLLQDIKDGHVDPDKYWDNHSKLMTGLGIILAGFSTSTAPNAALQFLNANMDRSIKAQAANLSSKQSLLSANLQQFGNMRDAMQMTRVMLSDDLQRRLDLAAAKTNDPMIKARALQMKGALQAQEAPQFMNLAMTKAKIGMMSQLSDIENGGGQSPERIISYLRLTDPEMAKEMTTRLVPGVNGAPSELASVPINEKTREKILVHQQLGDAARDLVDWVEKNGNNLNPKTVAEGKAKAMGLQSKVREAMLNTVYREGEQPLLDKIVNSDPTALYGSIRVLPGLKEVIKMNNKDYNIVRQSVGLKPTTGLESLSPQQKSFVEWAQKNPNDPRSPQILKKLGVQ